MLSRCSILFLLLLGAVHALEVADARCEYSSNPLGIDVRQPRLSWTLSSPVRGDLQTAYQILVASTRQALAANRGDLWNSGKVASSDSLNVLYAGRPLRSRTRYWWKVRVWDRQGKLSRWSAPAFWTVGPLEFRDWQAQWIGGAPAGGAALLLRREVAVERVPIRATAYIAGLGYHELYINGVRVGDHVLDPGFTDYSKRVLYVTHDLGPVFRPGKNAIGVILGNGWYNPQTPDLFGFEKAPWKASPKLLLRIDLEFPGGEHRAIVSDTAWKWSTGALTFNCIRAGETIEPDLDKPGWQAPGYDDQSWSQASLVEAPTGRLAAQRMPPMRVVESIAPVRVTEPKAGVFVFDFGVNLTGWARLRATGKPGQVVRIDFNETLLPDGTLDTKHSATHTYGRYQSGRLVLDRTGRGVFEPRFTYHGFRYVQVTGLSAAPVLSDMLGRWVHTSWQSAGTFACSDSKVNALHQAAIRTLHNACHSVPGEEATREKMGWTEDGLNTMESAVYNFDAALVYSNYLDTLIDAQELNGHVPPIVPTSGWGRTGHAGYNYSDPWWGGTLPYVAEKLYEYCGDRRVIEQAYEPMKRWVDYLTSTAKGDFIDWWLGDWLEPGCKGRPVRTPVVQTSTAGYYYAAMAVSRSATLLGKPDDARCYLRLAERIRDSFNSRFLDRATGLYAKDSQTSQTLPLWLDMVPREQRSRVLSRLLDNIHAWSDHVSTGFVGVMPMLHGLVDWGHADLAWTLVTQPEPPGFWHMIADGNSTLSESLDGKAGSRHHPFGACVDAWFYRTLAGIRADAASPGFRHFFIRPEPVGALTWVRVSFDSVRGTIRSAWKREGTRFHLALTIPPNSTATVYLPTSVPSSVTESGGPVSRAQRVRFLRAAEGKAVYEVGSGVYNFSCEIGGGQP